VGQETKTERRIRTCQRIHRLQGQLSALERAIDDEKPCENIVIQARAIEKAVSSLITHVIGGYLEHQLKDLMQTDPEGAIVEITRIFELSNH